MSGIGPDLPPHLLAKRKRQQEAQDEVTRDVSQRSEDDATEKRRRVAVEDNGAKDAGNTIGAVRPPSTATTIGPSLPPAPLDERPAGSLPYKDSDSDDSDDDLGPALPTTSGKAVCIFETVLSQN